jgi:hypothetical protein
MKRIGRRARTDDQHSHRLQRRCFGVHIQNSKSNILNRNINRDPQAIIPVEMWLRITTSQPLNGR